MDVARFKQIVNTFLDSSDQLQMEKGTFVLQFANELIEAELKVQNSQLYVIQDDRQQLAEDWIVRRLAALDILADRILSAIPENQKFVTPRGQFLDEIERAPSEDLQPVDDAVVAVDEFLSRRPGGTCSVLYLTSDAGEGKTTVINYLARQKALAFKNRQADWLLVPIGLGGRPFLRFDDVVMAAFMNQLRFQRLYFDAFVELVKMGVIVPALDGFEEIFVETSEGDAVSSLGTLIRQMEGQGTLLIAARRAYFEFRRLETQARLLDALPDVDVGFGRVSLNRWTKKEFVTFAELNGIQDGETLYESIASKISPSHPLLTRAVLVRRLVEIARDTTDTTFVQSLRPEADQFMTWLVDKLLEREAKMKWIDKYGDPPKPLLTVQEHHALLSFVAEEMWISKTAVLTAEMLDSLAELYCDSVSKTPIVSRQVKERLKQHALIVSFGTSKREFGFDHDDFREYFLGEQLASHILARQESDIRKIARTELLSALSLDTTALRIISSAPSVDECLSFLQKVAHTESTSTFIRENIGGLVVRLLETHGAEMFRVSQLVFPQDSLAERSISNAQFENCYFRPSKLSNTVLSDCKFDSCEFEHLGLEEGCHFSNVKLSDDTNVHSLTVLVQGEAIDYYSPEEIRVLLQRKGFCIGDPVAESRSIDLDHRLRMTVKALHTFQRSTHVTQGTFKLRLSINASTFLEEILPELLDAGLIQVAKQSSTGPRYKLGVSLSRVEDALASSGGSYDRFLKAFRTAA